MTSLPEAAQQAGSPLEAFSGPIARTKTGPLYSAGLAVVAFAMVLLPIIYLALIVFAAWAVLFHLKNDTWIFESGSGGGILRLILYLGPAVAGGILIFFMVKPFFAAKAKTPDAVTLEPAKEPLLFAFVQKICGLVGAPTPSRIDVDCQVNASASLKRGFWSRDLVLTIGLPLASGLDMRQFAGVLAHEFGHFAQGAGMRLTYVIRKISFWFARVVYERDAWDVRLEESARGSDWRIRIVLYGARGCVWLSRRILWALMHTGHALSCFMLRQMEFDADSYEAKVAGSDAFESTASRLRVLNAATQTAYEDVRQSWASSRLPEDLPLLIHHKAGSLSAELREKLSTSAASGKTGWFDTHPCDADRVRAARRLNEPGAFRLTQPAMGLFSDFSALSKTVTRHQYEKHFELQFTDQNLMSAEEILRESAASTEADAMIRKYYGGVAIHLKPLLVTSELPGALPNLDSGLGSDSVPGEEEEAVQETEALRAEAERLSTECIEQQKRQSGLITALILSKARFKLEPKAFGLREGATSPAEQETAASRALSETSAAISVTLEKLEPFVSALRQRVTCALRGSNSGSEVAELAELLAVVGAEMSRAQELGTKANAFLVLVKNRGNHPNPGAVDEVASELAAELRSLLDGIQERLKPFAYPFPHARGQLTVAEYARYDKTTESDWQRVYLDSSTHAERLFALHYRLTGQVLARFDAVESHANQGAVNE